MLLAAALAAGCRHGAQRRADAPPPAPGSAQRFADRSPRWSHDGLHIAFLRETSDHRIQLMACDARLTNCEPLLEPEVVSPDRGLQSSTASYASPDAPAWSPDDRRIALERVEWFTFDDGSRFPGTGIWSADLRTGRVQPVAIHSRRYTSLFYYYHNPCWSPDGRKIAFTAEGINGQRSIGVRTLSAGSPVVIPRFDNYSASDWPAWSPNGSPPSALALVQSIQRSQGIPRTETIRVVHPGSALSSGEIVRLHSRAFDGPAGGLAPGQRAMLRAAHLAWSPDASRLAFTLDANPNDAAHAEIWSVNRFGAGLERVAPEFPRGLTAPTWLSNKSLGAISPAADGVNAVVIDSGGSAHRVAKLPTADCDWSPDHTRIVCATGREGDTANDETTLVLVPVGDAR